MAVLNKIRQRSFFLIIIIALALFAFVLADLFRGGGFSGNKALKTIGEVNGNEIKTSDFQNRLERVSRGRSSMSLVNNVWNQMLNEELVSQQVQKIGITTDSAHLRGAIENSFASDPTFQDEDGTFDYAKVQAYVADLKENNPDRYYSFWTNVEKDLLKNEASNIYFDMVKAGIHFSNKDGEIEHKASNETLNMKYVQLPYSSIADSTITVSKSEILDYIKARKKQFTQEANVDLLYVKINEKASLEDENAIKADLQALIDNSVEYNSQIGANDTIAGFASTQNVEDFVNANSSNKYNARFQFKDKLSKELADNLFDAEIGKVYGPYKEGSVMKLAKLVAETKMPDSAKASHILVSWEGLRTAQEVTRTKEEAKKLADSIKTIITKSPKKFAELAKTFSADNSNSGKGGDLGYFTPGAMVPAFNNFVFENAKGDIGIVETQFGYHVISIEDLSDKKKAVKIAEITRAIEPSEKTIGEIYAKASDFAQNVKSKDFKEVAKEEGYSASPVSEVKILDEYIPAVGQQRSVVRWAFNKENEIGKVKRFDIPSGYLIVKLVKRREAGLKSVESASAEVLPILRKEKKAKLLKAKIKAPDLKSIAVSNGTTVRTASAISFKTGSISGAGVEKKVVGTAFGLKEGEVSTPITGEKGVYVVEVTSKTPAQELASYKGVANRNATTDINSVQTSLAKALKEKVEIIDRRADLY